MNQRLQQIGAASLLLAATTFIVLPLVSYFERPVYLWEVSLPAFTQGGLEALALLALFAIAATLRLRKGAHLALLGGGIFIYLRLHAVELPFLFALAWLEGILATGAIFSARHERSNAGTLFSIRFALGICVWICGALLLSLLHLASALGLLVYSGLLFAAAIIILRKKPFTLTALKYMTHRDRWVGVCSAYILVSVLVLFVRSSNVIDFDSIWYGLRSEWVLAPYGSIFDRLNLIGQVYHYPKLFELLTLPANALIDFGFVYALNICVYFAFGIAAFALMRVAGMRSRHALLVMALAVCMPVMSTMAMTAKPDLLGSYFLLVGSLFFAIAIKRAEPVWYLGVFSTVLLGLSTKLSAIPFGGLLSMAALIALGWQLRGGGVRRGLGTSWARGPIVFLSAISVLIFLAFSWRTYHMTGYPILGDKLITRTFDFLGFQPRYPAHIRTDEGFVFAGSRLTVLYDYLFRPTELNSVSSVWPGNAGALLFVAGCVSAMLSRSRSTWVKIGAGLGPIVVAAYLLMIFYGNNAGGDGNYYIFPFTLSALLGIGLIWQSVGLLRSVLLLILPVLVGANTCLGFLLSPGLQHPGTAPFSLNFVRSPFHTGQTRDAELQAKGLLPIQQFILRNMASDCRAVAAGDWQGVYMLPCTAENIAVHWEANPIVNSESAFVRYLNFARINLLISPKFPADTPLFNTADNLRRSGLPVIETPSYFAIDLRTRIGNIMMPAAKAPIPGTRYAHLTEILPTASARDLASPESPRPDLYALAPYTYEFFTESDTLLLKSDSAVRFPLMAIGIAPPWIFSASIGFTPEESQHGDVPMNFEVKVVTADGRELAAQSWKISAGEYQVVSLRFHGAVGAAAYLEMSYHADTAANQQPLLLVGQPEIRSE